MFLAVASGTSLYEVRCSSTLITGSFMLVNPSFWSYFKCLLQQGRCDTSYYNSSSVCLCVCSLSPPRSFDGSSPNLVGVCRWTSHLPLRGSFSKRSTGRRVNGSLSLSTILYMRQPHGTQLQRRLLLCCYCCRV